MHRRQILIAALASFAAQPLARAACGPTEPDDLGPFFVKDAPAQSDLCANAGERARLQVAGRVLGGADCAPLAGALIEVWQADTRGAYTQVARNRKDDPGCLLRASLKTDAQGRYAFRTMLPGEYPGRPRHIHFRVSAPGHRALVTQLYFAPERGVDPSRVAKLAKLDAGSGGGPLEQTVFDITLVRG
jgi:protocatechuate 3,4-dioxygenase beta subunit